jgi:cell division protein FtsB
MENLQDIINNSAQKFVKSKEQILDRNIGYILLGVFFILIALIVVLGGASFGLCKKMDLGRVCTMRPLYRNLFLLSNLLALLFWMLYYLAIRKKQEFVKENSYKQFFPADVQSEVNKLNQTSKVYFVLANLFSGPVYILFFIILYNVISFVFNLFGLPFLV